MAGWFDGTSQRDSLRKRVAIELLKPQYKLRIEL